MKPMRMQRGDAAEDLALRYLQLRGLKILRRNFRCKAGELDVICLDDGVLVIVEVRQRNSAEFGGALGSVTSIKQGKIIRAAQFLLQREKHWRNLSMRFDVLAIEGLPDGAHRVTWVKDAFRGT